MRELDVLMMRANFMEAHPWAKLWAATARRLSVACWRREESATWDWWLEQVLKVPPDIPAKLLAQEAQASMDPGGQPDPAFSAEWEYLFGDEGVHSCDTFLDEVKWAKAWIGLHRRYDAPGKYGEDYDRWLEEWLRIVKAGMEVKL